MGGLPTETELLKGHLVTWKTFDVGELEGREEVSTSLNVMLESL